MLVKGATVDLISWSMNLSQLCQSTLLWPTVAWGVISWLICRNKRQVHIRRNEEYVQYSKYGHSFRRPISKLFCDIIAEAIEVKNILHDLLCTFHIWNEIESMFKFRLIKNDAFWYQQWFCKFGISSRWTIRGPFWKYVFRCFRYEWTTLHLPSTRTTWCHEIFSQKI